jgi:hypothetical protein
MFGRKGNRLRHTTLAWSMAALAGLFIGGAAQAATVAHWQFEGVDGQMAPSTAGAVPTSVNSPALNGTAGVTNAGAPIPASGTLPSYDDMVAGPVIRDGVGGAIITSNNATSLKFTNGGLDLATPDLNNAAGGKVTVAGSDTLLHDRSFTIELFARKDRHANFTTLVSKSRVDGNGTSWMLDIDGNANLRARVDSQAPGVPTGQPTPPGFNQGFTTSSKINEDQWYHVAMTYQEVLDADVLKGQLTIFVDYQQVRQGFTTFLLVYDNNPLVIGSGGGGRAFDGWIDEVRYSDTVLTTSQFLRAETIAIPEPAALGLLALGAASAMRRRG